MREVICWTCANEGVSFLNARVVHLCGFELRGACRDSTYFWHGARVATPDARAADKHAVARICHFFREGRGSEHCGFTRFSEKGALLRGHDFLCSVPSTDPNGVRQLLVHISCMYWRKSSWRDMHARGPSVPELLRIPFNCHLYYPCLCHLSLSLKPDTLPPLSCRPIVFVPVR